MILTVPGIVGINLNQKEILKHVILKIFAKKKNSIPRIGNFKTTVNISLYSFHCIKAVKVYISTFNLVPFFCDKLFLQYRWSLVHLLKDCRPSSSSRSAAKCSLIFTTLHFNLLVVISRSKFLNQETVIAR